MNTTLTVKINRQLRDDAKRAAEGLGLPLTTVVTALMRQFVRDKEVVVSAELKPTRAKIALWRRISLEMNAEKNQPKFYNAADLFKDLGLHR
ncbi:MAG: hypothetical protein AAB767_01935 [Patescibacteria group bacterium]